MTDQAIAPNVAPEDTLDEFCLRIKTLLLAIQNYFPECKKTEEALEYLEVVLPTAIDVEEDSENGAPPEPHPFKGNDMLKKFIINEWYQSMLPYLDACNKKDARALLGADIDALDKFGFREKWAEFDEESKEVMWEYLTAINTLAVWYCEGEKNMTEKDVMDRITDAAKGFVEQHDDGKITIDPKKLQDPEAMAQIGALLGDVQSIMGSNGDSSGIAQIASSLLGNMGGPAGNPADVLGAVFGGGQRKGKGKSKMNY